MSARDGWFDRWLAASGALARHPQYVGVLARMSPVASRAVNTMAVALQRPRDPASRVDLLVNVAYFEAHPEHWAGILQHEIHHVVLGHLTDTKFHYVDRPRLMELAMEVSANELVVDALPDGVVLLRDFTALGLAPGQSTMQRYVLLVAAQRAGLLRDDSYAGRMVDAHHPGGDGASQGAGLGDVLDRRSDGASARNWNRVGGLAPPTDPYMLARMKQSLHDHLRGAAGGDDDLVRDPSQPRLAKELERVFVEAGGRRELDWPRVLARAFPQRRVVRPDYLRVNRRFPQRLGEIPGRARRPPRPSLLACVDTSGSMSVEALGRVARELRRLGRHARVTVVECDAAVHRVYCLPAALGPFLGGGDTDFSPAFEAAQGGHRGHEGLVYFTDGRGEYPTRAPGIPTLWVLTHDGPFACPFGAVVRLLDA